jgi:hypothetical protein
MATCPSGHETAATDFCDVCGMRVRAPAAAPSFLRETAAPPGLPPKPCPNCGAEQSGRFCEACGIDLSSAPPDRPPAVRPAPASAPAGLQGSGRAAPRHAAPAGIGPAGDLGSAASPPAGGSRASAPPAWSAVATADPEYFARVCPAGGPDAPAMEFPEYCPPRLFRLTGREARIGRRSVSRGIEPEIDLTGPPTDPGVSHLHAVLTAEPDGSWTLMDPGSANGTQLNGAELAPGLRVRLHPGDRICIGAWTALTIQVS